MGSGYRRFKAGNRTATVHYQLSDGAAALVTERPFAPEPVEEDARPTVSVLSPVTDVEVDPKARVTVRFEAQDDFGLSEVALLFNLASRGE